MDRKIETGKTYEYEFPFVRLETSWLDKDEIWWKPGFEVERDDDFHCSMATGMGKAIVEVIAICELPGRYQDRVFFKRTWQAPDGLVFGGNNLQVKTLSGFLKMLEGMIPDNWDEDYRVWKDDK